MFWKNIDLDVFNDVWKKTETSCLRCILAMFLVTILNELKIAENPFIFETMCDNNVFIL